MSRKEEEISRPLWTAGEVAEAVEGALEGQEDWCATGISIDTRTLQPGELFVALNGEHHNGHAYLCAATQAHAAAAVISEPVTPLPPSLPCVRVTDTLGALWRLAEKARARSHARHIGVTGSVGKTSVKEMLQAACTPQGATFASRGNYNNHIGLPLVLSRMPEGMRFGIFELGMNHSGEITELTRLLRPDIAIVTAIAPAHLENLGSMEAIARAKAEIFEGVTRGGVAIIPADTPFRELLEAAAREQGVGSVLHFGRTDDAAAKLLEYQADDTGAAITAVINGTKFSYRLGCVGEHWAVNSLAVLLAVEAAGGDLAQAAAGLAQFHEPEGRGRRLVLPWKNGRVTVLDDSYNASPAAVRAAIARLAQMTPEGEGRRIAVLGDMLELGAESAGLHRAVADVLQEFHIDAVLTCGVQMQALHDVLSRDMALGHFMDSKSAAEALPGFIHPGDVLLIKGSRGMTMERVMDGICSDSGIS